jgi:hypothetical protein
MFSRFHREVSAQDPENMKWDVDELSQFHRSRKVVQLLRFLVCCELGKVSHERRQKSTNKIVACIFFVLLSFFRSPPSFSLFLPFLPFTKSFGSTYYSQPRG